MLDLITKVNIDDTLQQCDFNNKIKRLLHLHFCRVLLKRGTENGTENGTEWKTEWKGKRNESFEGKQNIWISLIQLLTKKIDLKWNKTLIFNQILANTTLIFNIWTCFMLTILQFSKDSLNLRVKKFVIWEIQTTLVKLKKNVSEFKINLIYRGYTVISK